MGCVASKVKEAGGVEGVMAMFDKPKKELEPTQDEGNDSEDDGEEIVEEGAAEDAPKMRRLGGWASPYLAQAKEEIPSSFDFPSLGSLGDSPSLPGTGGSPSKPAGGGGGAWGSQASTLIAGLKADGEEQEEAKGEDKETTEETKEETETETKAQVARPPLYNKLPSDAEHFDVRNVYDGDTLTLSNQERVRFLGVDCPEVKEKQPFAQEAKEYTKSRCHSELWLSYEEEKADHYGRLLAHVWAVEPGTDGKLYCCVNEGLVAHGFANAYAPGGKGAKKPRNMGNLMKLQRKARLEGLGKWGEFTDMDVVKTKNGSAFHLRSCENIAKFRNLTQLLVSEAMDIGISPCRTCLPDN